MTRHDTSPPWSTLAELIQKQSRNEPALVFHPLEGGRHIVTYEELASEAGRVAAGLGDAGGRRIGILAPNRPEWLAAAFGIWMAGGVLVALNTWWRRGELLHALRLAEVSTLFVQPTFLDHDYLDDLEAIRPELPTLERVIKFDSDYADLAGTASSLRVEPGDHAVILFTSGTTASSKGVVHRHKAIVRNAWNISARQLLQDTDAVWMNFPLFFSAGLINCATGALSRGCRLVFQERFDPAGALRMIEEERCSVFQTWPTAARELARHPAFPSADLSSLRKGTGPLDLAGPLKREEGLGVNMYGMTETCTAVTCTWGDDPAEVRRNTQGGPFPGVEIRICDPETGRDLDSGEQGEIRVRGYPVMEGYLGEPRAEAFDSDGYLKTNDLGFLDGDGRLHYLARLTDTIKTHGINVSPAEVESVLRDHPSIEAAAVLGIPDPGDPLEERVYAAVVLKQDASLDPEALKNFCAERLAAYKVPSVFERVDELPLDTTGGKVQKFKLREAAMQSVARTA